MTKQCELDNESIGILCIIGLVVILILIRACIPPEWHHPSERPATPPESLYKPGGR